MDRKNNKNNRSFNAITILSILVVLLTAYIGFDIFFSKNNTNNYNKDNTNNEVSKSEDDIKKGECPLTKINSDYILTDTDKEEIMESLESLNAGFTNQNIDVNSLTIDTISESGYYFNVKFNDTNKSELFAYIVKVNNKLKVLNAGSGDSIDGVKRMEYTLKRICS